MTKSALLAQASSRELGEWFVRDQLLAERRRIAALQADLAARVAAKIEAPVHVDRHRPTMP